VAHKIWLHRKSVVFSGEFTHPSHLICGVKEALEDFHSVVHKKRPNVDRERIEDDPKWMAPWSGLIKVN
jgi:hypothetical protein